MNLPAYRILEHTADIGIEVRGDALEDVFSNAAYGFSDLITDAAALGTPVSRTLDLNAEDIEQLFHRWLSELLYIFESERLIFRKAEILEMRENGLKARLSGEKFDRNRHESRYEIKAVTLHGLKVSRETGAWIARVLFDI
jgi:SHS2 domain-containing protein